MGKKFVSIGLESDVVKILKSVVKEMNTRNPKESFTKSSVIWDALSLYRKQNNLIIIKLNEEEH